MPSYAPRISLPFKDLSGVCTEWAKVASVVVCYQHDADLKTKTTHCHFLILDSTLKEEALKRRFHKLVPKAPDRERNALWEWLHKEHPNPDKGFITYMSKGHLKPCFVQGIGGDEIEEYRLKWVAPSRPTLASDKKYNEWEDIRHDASSQTDYITSLDIARTWTMRWYWTKYGRLPPTGVYKQNASSIWLFIRQHREGDIGLRFGIEEIKNLWY